MGMFAIITGVPGALLAAWYLRKCPVVETFEFVWELGGRRGF